MDKELQLHEQQILLKHRNGNHYEVVTGMAPSQPQLSHETITNNTENQALLTHKARYQSESLTETKKKTSLSFKKTQTSSYAQSSYSKTAKHGNNKTQAPLPHISSQVLQFIYFIYFFISTQLTSSMIQVTILNFEKRHIANENNNITCKLHIGQC